MRHVIGIVRCLLLRSAHIFERYMCISLEVPARNVDSIAACNFYGSPPEFSGCRPF
jgi:hypothetical protein